MDMWVTQCTGRRIGLHGFRWLSLSFSRSVSIFLASHRLKVMTGISMHSHPPPPTFFSYISLQILPCRNAELEVKVKKENLPFHYIVSSPVLSHIFVFFCLFPTHLFPLFCFAVLSLSRLLVYPSPISCQK